MRKAIMLLLVIIAAGSIAIMLAYEQGQQVGQRAGYVAGREEGKEAGYKAGQKIGEQYCMTSQAGLQQYHFYRGVYITCNRTFRNPKFCNDAVLSGVEIGLFSIEDYILQEGFEYPREQGREG